MAEQSTTETGPWAYTPVGLDDSPIRVLQAWSASRNGMQPASAVDLLLDYQRQHRLRFVALDEDALAEARKAFIAWSHAGHDTDEERGAATDLALAVRGLLQWSVE